MRTLVAASLLALTAGVLAPTAATADGVDAPGVALRAATAGGGGPGAADHP